MSATTRLIGIDCSTDPKKVGLAVGRLDGKKPVITHAECGETWGDIDNKVKQWIEEGTKKKQKVLLAIDAPLGWPRPLGDALVSHEAGCAFQNVEDDCPFQRKKNRKTSKADLLFQRATDRRIHDALDIKPLDVGANLIARTAYSALSFLGRLRCKTKLPIPLMSISCTESAGDVLAIEVYPAATLKRYGFPYNGYKDKKEAHLEARACIIRRLDDKMKLHENIKKKMQASSDIIDAVVCVLAAADFVKGDAMPPENKKLAKKEGWIWVRKP